VRFAALLQANSATPLPPALFALLSDTCAGAPPPPPPPAPPTAPHLWLPPAVEGASAPTAAAFPPDAPFGAAGGAFGGFDALGDALRAEYAGGGFGAGW
jgi:hypothetical protein